MIAKRFFTVKVAVIILTMIMVLGSVACSSTGDKGTFFGLGQCEAEGYYREELSEGVKNTLLRARQMYEIEWTPLEDIPMFSTEENVPKLFKAGETYRGIPYGQPVHQGKYLGYGATLEEFLQESMTENSAFYAERGLNTELVDPETGKGPVKSSPFYSSDCSSFVSYCWDLAGRTTTGMIDADPERFPVVGDTVQELKPGLAINAPYEHIILIYDVVYNKDGKVVSVTTIEQTPPIMTMKTFGLGGTAGSLDDLQAKLDDTYDIIAYRDIENVKYEASSAVLVAEKDYVGGIELPVSAVSVNAPATGKAIVCVDDKTFEFSGFALCKEGFKSFEYTINEGEAESLKSTWNEDYCSPNTVYYDFAGSGGKNHFYGKLKTDFKGEINIMVSGITESGEKIVVADFVVETYYKVEVFKSMAFDEPAEFYAGEDGKYSAEIKYSDVSQKAVDFSGWFVCEGDVRRFEMSVDGGIWMPVTTTLREDVYSRQYGDFPDCRNNNAFSGRIDLSYLSQYDAHTVTLRAVTADNSVYNLATWDFEHEKTGLMKTVVIALAALLAAAIATTVIVIIVVKKAPKKDKAPEKASKTKVKKSAAPTENTVAEAPVEKASEED